MTIKQHGGVFGRNPTFNDVTVEGDLSIDGTLTIGGNVITGLDYEGGWNASTNTPDLTTTPPAAGGKFWIVSVAGSTNLGGITNWTVGDWALYDGSAWQRVEGGTVDLTNGVTGILPIANGGTNASDASTARTNLGSGAVGDNLFTAVTATNAQQAMDTEVGVDVQAYDAGLQSISGLTTAADKMIYTTASDTYAVADLTAAGRAILDDADAAAQRTTLGLGTAATTASTDYATAAQGSTADSALQPGDVDDTPVDGATQDPISSNWAYDHAALTTAHGISSFGATLVDDADAATARTTLGLGSAATTASTDYATAAQGSTADSAMQDLVDDTTPQLGGDLDLNSSDITGTGDINITGTVTADALQSDGDVTIVDKIVHSGDTNTAIRFPSNDTVTMEVAGSEVFRANSSGNLGFKTSSPSVDFDFNGVARIGGEYIHSFSSGSTSPGDKLRLTITFPADDTGGLFKFEYATGRNSTSSDSARQCLVVYLRAFSRSDVVDSVFGETEIYAQDASMASNFTVASSGTTDRTFTVDYENTSGTGFFQIEARVAYLSGRGNNVSITKSIV